MLLGAEIAISLLGLYWLITGKAKVSKTKQLAGMPARILGFILLLTLPFVFLVGIVIGTLIGTGVLPESLMPYTFIGDILCIVVVFLIVTVYSAASKSQATETPGS